ncbi:Putative endonuclease or glycosyl hydrolase [Striga hermonthica]|uniref:Endonuclease or glycosyl hydrolase n=1 Tax=Striga hermonthica TaxID=68872 RepID=A0A9N7MLT6_STRHE|nr:Putative endonuclease or glycosyl hydrolase [Striga hermonthica]
MSSSSPKTPTPEPPSPNQIPSPNQARTILNGPVAILWDIENCPVPSDVRPEDVAGNIRMALRVHPIIRGAVTMFSAYGDFNSFPRRLREGCQRTGVKLVDVPNGRKDAADKAILVDMFLFALDNSPPSSIVLISGDVDFAPALHILGQRGYTVVLVIPSKIGVSSALCSAGRFVWDWSSVVRGEGFFPPPAARLAGDLARISDEAEEESIVYKGICDLGLQSPSEAQVGNCCGPNEVNDGVAWVQPGDLNGLKGQIVKLVEMSGGVLQLMKLPSEYQRNYGRPLYVSEYGSGKLVNLLKKMVDVVSVEGTGQKKVVCLQSPRIGLDSRQPVILAKREKRGNDGEEVSDDEGGEKKSGSFREMENNNLDNFRYELQEILVSYSCRIFMGCFEEIYCQRYKRQLDYKRFGVSRLEELLEKVKDVVVLEEDPVSKRRFMVAVGG